jgi:hypothetical protein
MPGSFQQRCQQLEEVLVSPLGPLETCGKDIAPLNPFFRLELS